MNLRGYIDRLEASYDDPAILRVIQEEAERDPDLVPDDRDLVTGRAGTYLADMARARRPW